MSFVFETGETKKVFVGLNEPESLKLAVNDLIKDVNAVCGTATLAKDAKSADIVVCSDESDLFAELYGDFAFSREEEFFYEIKKDKIIICGNGDWERCGVFIPFPKTNWVFRLIIFSTISARQDTKNCI